MPTEITARHVRKWMSVISNQLARWLLLQQPLGDGYPRVLAPSDVFFFNRGGIFGCQIVTTATLEAASLPSKITVLEPRSKISS